MRKAYMHLFSLYKNENMRLTEVMPMMIYKMQRLKMIKNKITD